MLEIRRASEADAETLTQLGKMTFIETFAKDNSQENMDHYVANTFRIDLQLSEIRDPKRMIEIAWLDGSAVGFLHLFESQADPCVQGLEPLEILRLYVDSRCHGKGVGAALMERILELARSESFSTLWLGVWENNLRAQAFYKKYGFIVKGKHVFHLGKDEQTDLIMAREA